MLACAQVNDVRTYLGDYLRQKGIHTKKPFRCLSPEHEDLHPSMSYNVQADNVHCFSCGVTYDLFDLVGMDYRLDSFPDKLKKASELFGVPFTTGTTWEPRLVERMRKPSSPDRSDWLRGMLAGRDASPDYLFSRGITQESCEKHSLFQKDGRAWFPIFEGGVCTGWCGRALAETTQPRYTNSAGKLGLWNGDLLRASGEGEVFYITEGILDAICLEQLGKKAVALCGSQNAGKLLRLLRDKPVSGLRFIACGDADAAGGKMNSALRDGLAELGLHCAALPLESGDINALYLRDQNALRTLLDETEQSSIMSGFQRESFPLAGSGAESLGSFLSPAADLLSGFFTEVQKRSVMPRVSTGFSALDGALGGGLHEGLYILGAISSLGKTSFLLQLADHIAGAGTDVLFFSLEQSRFELMAKSLSRLTVRTGGKHGVTARELMNGQIGSSLHTRELLQKAVVAYGKTAEHLFLYEGVADIGAQEIARLVDEHVRQRGTRPVVMVDYLQILAPADPRTTDKQNVDRAVVALKRLSREHGIPVMAVSSFNRDNYRAAVSMEAFKESGAVEYSSDVLLGMQLKGAGQKDFDVNTAKSRPVREVELVMLKNRSGVPYAKMNFRYGAAHNLFAEG